MTVVVIPGRRGLVDECPPAEATLDAASQLGIKHYWWGTYRYDLAKPIAPQIEALKPRVAKLAKLNEMRVKGANNVN